MSQSGDFGGHAAAPRRMSSSAGGSLFHAEDDSASLKTSNSMSRRVTESGGLGWYSS